MKNVNVGKFSLAKAAYDAYCASVGGKSAVTGEALPDFKDVSPAIHQAWLAAAYEVAKECTGSKASAVNTSFQRVCIEWAKGCSCASVDKPEECEPCTSAFLEVVKKLAAIYVEP